MVPEGDPSSRQRKLLAKVDQTHAAKGRRNRDVGGALPTEIARALSEAREALRGYEATALAGVAVTLAEAAESLARTARELHEMRRDE